DAFIVAALVAGERTQKIGGARFVGLEGEDLAIDRGSLVETTGAVALKALTEKLVDGWGHGRAAKVSSSEATRWMTSDQLLGVRCRKSRIVGYQGESSRCSI